MNTQNKFAYPFNPLFSLPGQMVIVRHTESEGDALDDDGVANHPSPSHKFGLTEKGKQQAFAVGRKLKELFPDKRHFDVLAVSTYLRTLLTCRHALSEHRFNSLYPIVYEPMLNEKDEGIRHKLTQVDLEQYFSLTQRLFKKYGKYHHIPLHGESVPQVELRIRGLIRDLILNPNICRGLFFSHRAWMRILHHMVSMGEVDSYEQRDGLPHPKNGSIYVYTKRHNHIELVIHDDHIAE